MNNVSPLPRRRVPPPSPERATLAERIAILVEAEATHAALTAAVAWNGQAATAASAAGTALQAAQAALEQAQRDAASHLVSTALGNAAAPAVTVRDARARVQAAQDDLDAAVAARQTIASRITPAEHAVAAARRAVEAAAQAVIRAEAPVAALLDELDALHRRVADKGRLLEWLLFSGGVPRSGPDALPNIIEMASRATTPPVSWAVARTPTASPSAAAWEQAMQALQRDATAPLP